MYIAETTHEVPDCRNDLQSVRPIPENGGQWQKKGTAERLAKCRMLPKQLATYRVTHPSCHSDTKTVAPQKRKDRDYDDRPTEPGQMAVYLCIDRCHQHLALSHRIRDYRTVQLCHGVSDMYQYRQTRFVHLQETATAERTIIQTHQTCLRMLCETKWCAIETCNADNRTFQGKVVGRGVCQEGLTFAGINARPSKQKRRT